mgnify:CR=1 FL=1
MSKEITVPTLGESVTEGTIGEWLKKPGDAVAVDEPIASLETDKVAVEVPSPVAGVLLDRLGHFGVVDQPLDHVVAPRDLERFDGPREPLVQPRDRAFHPATKEPAHRRKQEVGRKGHGREGENEDQGPEGQFHRAVHVSVVPSGPARNNQNRAIG